MISHSKIVLFLKLAFFISAVSILGILFLIPPPDKFGEPVTVSTLGLEKNIAYQIIGAKLRGAAKSGHRFDFMIDSIDPDKDNPENFSLTNLNGTLSLYERDIYEISAKRALINSNENFIDLMGDLNIKSSRGITGKSQKIRLDWDSVDVIVSKQVEIKTPLGTVYSGTMKIPNNSIGSKENPYVHFEEGVKLVYKKSIEPWEK